MKIAQFNCLQRSVPPQKSGGIEKVMDYLVKGLAARGHQVTLFSTGNSQVPEGQELVSVYPESLEDSAFDEQTQHVLNREHTHKLAQVLLDRQYEFDIIHNHCLAAALPVITQTTNTMVSTIHEAIEPETVKRYTPFKDLNYVSVSYAQRAPFPTLNYVANIYHGIDISKYPKPKKAQNYYVFVGRISAQKQPHLAILAAAKMKKKLVILGKYKDFATEGAYYNDIFYPVLMENAKYVEWLGDVKEMEVMNILNQGIVSLLPVEFREPFGLSCIESMSVGCPVIAFDKGAYSETIINGKTGFVVQNLDEMVAKLKKVEAINRKDCRKHVEKNFTVDRMVEEYIKLYEQMISPTANKLDLTSTQGTTPFI